MIFASFLALALPASIALGLGTAWLVVRRSKKPILWTLTPLFALLWLAAGVTPLVFLAYSMQRAPVPPPLPPAPVQVAPAETAPQP